MSREILIEKSTERKWNTLPTDEQHKLKDLLEAIARLPEPSKHEKVALLRGPTQSVYRLRKGDFRVVFTTEYGSLKIHMVGRRKTIYRGINETYTKISA